MIIVANGPRLPGTVREAQTAIRANSNGSVTVIAPSNPGGAMILNITKSGVALAGTIPDKYQWDYTGTAGIFLNGHTAYFVSLSRSGIVTRKFEVPTDGTPAITPSQVP